MVSPSSPKTRSARPRKPRARWSLARKTIHTGVVPKTVIRPGTAVSIATGGMVPRGADAVVMVEYAETDGRELRIARAVTRRKRGLVRRNRYHRGRDRAPAWPAPDEPRYRGPGRDRRRCASTSGESRSSPSSPPATRSSLPASRCNPQRSTTRTRRSSPTPCASSAASRSGWGSRPTTWTPCGNGFSTPSTFADVVLLSGGTSKGAGDSVVPRGGRAARSGNRGARRRTQAWQADLSCGDSWPPRCRAPGLSDVGDLHVSRVRGAGASPAGGPRARRSEPWCRPDWP